MLELVCINAYHSSMNKRPKKPDFNQLAKFIVDEATGEIEKESDYNGKDKAAQALGRKGGKARAAALSQEQREEIARYAAQARWKKN